MKYLYCLALITLCTIANAQSEGKAATIVQKQLDAYNARDIDAFMETYSDSVKIYNHPNELIMSGKEELRNRYATMFKRMPDMYGTLMNRMVLGNTVIDQERVVFIKNDPPVEVFAMYKIAKGKIQEVYFIRPN